MKIFLLLPAVASAYLFDSSSFNASYLNSIDSTAIVHVLDGTITEWPADKFMTDKATSIKYAVDNDNQILFLAINISNRSIQKKIIEGGLNLFLDVKGKKKKNKGIEFPAKTETLASFEGMRLFGFNDAEPFLMSVNTKGTANAAIAWDSTYIMQIEYNIPLKMLEENLADLNNKKISIGWEVNESEMSSPNAQTSNTPQVVRTQVVAVPTGTRPSGNRNTSNTNNNPVMQSNSNKSQSIWTSHTIIF